MSDAENNLASANVFRPLALAECRDNHLPDRARPVFAGSRSVQRSAPSSRIVGKIGDSKEGTQLSDRYLSIGIGKRAPPAVRAAGRERLRCDQTIRSRASALRTSVRYGGVPPTLGGAGFAGTTRSGRARGREGSRTRHPHGLGGQSARCAALPPTGEKLQETRCCGCCQKGRNRSRQSRPRSVW